MSASLLSRFNLALPLRRFDKRPCRRWGHDRGESRILGLCEGESTRDSKTDGFCELTSATAKIGSVGARLGNSEDCDSCDSTRCMFRHFGETHLETMPVDGELAVRTLQEYSLSDN
jgi:hypothetical protein